MEAAALPARTLLQLLHDELLLEAAPESLEIPAPDASNHGAPHGPGGVTGGENGCGAKLN